MYKFTNGMVVFDEKTRDEFIKAGYRLIKEEVNCINNDINEVINEINEAENENTSNDGTIEEKPRRSKKVSE